MMENLTIISTAVIAIFTVIYSITTIFMFIAIHRQYKEMKVARQLYAQPFIVLANFSVSAVGPVAKRNYPDQGQFSLSTYVCISAKIKNLGNSPAIALRAITKMRLSDKDGKEYSKYSLWEPIDYLSVGEEKEVHFSFALEDHDFFHHIIEIERMEQEAGSSFLYQKELDSMEPRIELFIMFANLNGGGFLLESEINLAYSNKLTPTFSNWLTVVETIPIDYAGQIKLHDETHSFEKRDLLFDELKQVIKEKVGEPDEVLIDTTIVESQTHFLDDKETKLFMREWHDKLKNGINAQLDLLKVNPNSTWE